MELKEITLTAAERAAASEGQLVGPGDREAVRQVRADRHSTCRRGFEAVVDQSTAAIFCDHPFLEPSDQAQWLRGILDRPDVRTTHTELFALPQIVSARTDDARGRAAALFARLTETIVELQPEEAELAKAEISEKVSQVGSGVAELAVGGAIVFSGFLVLLAAAVAGLALFLPTEHAAWLSPLVVGLVVMIVGFIVVSKGRKELKSGNLRPERTMQSMRQDADLAKEHWR